jgi:NAD(P)-dependent dehydrogenase (short-subunit alcohol dehydrogenase family)
MDVRMDGRCALITGASRGLGFAMAKKFAESGADVAICARREDVLEQARAEIAALGGGKTVALVCDVSDAAALEAMFAGVLKALGKVDILVNNAGSSVSGDFESITDEIWQSDMELKLFGAIRLARLALPGMKQRKWGRIINILNAGAKAPRPRGAPTHVTRAAGMALTKVLAGEFAPFGVLVNGLCTGTIVTDQIHGQLARSGKNISVEEFIEKKGRAVPLGRMGTAEEYASMACFLASEQASFISGCAINVDGGWSPVV